MEKLVEVARAVRDAANASHVESERIRTENDGYVDRRYEEIDQLANEAYDHYADVVNELVADPHALLRLLGEES